MPDEGRDAAWMQAVAREMNLSETAFLVPGTDGVPLRWFTPTVEVDLCGHAALASAHPLWEAGYLPPGAAARFQSRSGLLMATRRGARIEMDFPATPEEPASPPPRAGAGAREDETCTAFWSSTARRCRKPRIRPGP